MSTNLRVHIVPVGFEFRRVTEPLIHMHADRVYLIRYTEDDSAAEFSSQIVKELSQNYNHIQIENVFLDIWNLYDCIEKFHKIMNQESKNHVYVNVSTGTKITAIAGMLSCMMWKAQPYYAPVSYLDKQKTVRVSEHVQGQDLLPVYAIKQPRQEFMLILDLLSKNNGFMKKSKMINELENIQVISKTDEFHNNLSAPAKHSRLRSLLDPMERDWNLISVKSSGSRSIVSIELQGERALRIFGTGIDDPDRRRYLQDNDA